MEGSILMTVGWTLLCCGVIAWNRYSLLSGFMVDGLLLGIAVWGIIFAVRLQEYLAVRIFLGAVLAVLALLSMFGLYILSGFFLLNARKLLRREGRRFANMLTLFAGIGLSLYGLLTILVLVLQVPDWVHSLWTLLNAVLGLLFFHVVTYLTTMLLSSILPAGSKQDYVVVLGSGLIDGKAPPLLRRRVDRGIRLVHRQKRRSGKQAVLILSGGQGADEPRSEASAMREYALTAGADPRWICLEEQSVNTRENLLFSKRMMAARTPNQKIRCAVVTNNYHVMRAGILARRLGMRVAGVGCKTAGYYLPNAVMREYVAYLSLHKKRYLMLALSAVALVIAAKLLENHFGL